MSTDPRSPLLPDAYDEARSKLDGLPDVVSCKPATITVVNAYGRSETYILETRRQAKVGDRIFLQVHAGETNLRLVIPPEVTRAIARQYNALSAKARSKAAKAEALRRKEDGVIPFAPKAQA